MMLSQTDSQDLGTANDLTTLVTALPSQGSLYPHEKMEIHFRFSPRYTKSNKGWKTSDQPPPRKDYTLFMHIETVGSVAGISNNSSGGINNGGIACQLKDNNLHGGSFFFLEQCILIFFLYIENNQSTSTYVILVILMLSSFMNVSF